MNHYDDLQRFQEKTRTQNLNFQDLSSQAATREHGDWAILNQLKSRRRETLFSGAGRLGLRAVAAVGARGSVPPGRGGRSSGVNL